jgi:hypothetical protein
MLQSSHRSAWQQVVTLGLKDSKILWILHKDLRYPCIYVGMYLEGWVSPCTATLYGLLYVSTSWTGNVRNLAQRFPLGTWGLLRAVNLLHGSNSLKSLPKDFVPEFFRPEKFDDLRRD